ncbi:340_t:CDS:2 [Entrophospora sp. SA101]|nr:8562_t:CDS:2 [Entrophospora sp. SA101]CAJ0871175.1 340_t:CDS:2 [Entrophospora sp. SA101]
MAFFGARSWPTPIVRPLAPFLASGAIIFYAVFKLETKLQQEPPYDTDVRNPRESPLNVALVEC